MRVAAGGLVCACTCAHNYYVSAQKADRNIDYTQLSY